MSDDVALATKPINLNFPVGKDGMTGKDLLITLMGELNKQGYYLAGVIVSKNPADGFQIVGHLSSEWTLGIMKMVVDKFKEKNVANVETVSMGGTN
jgi:hypothetical protein